MNSSILSTLITFLTGTKHVGKLTLFAYSSPTCLGHVKLVSNHGSILLIITS